MQQYPQYFAFLLLFRTILLTGTLGKSDLRRREVLTLTSHQNLFLTYLWTISIPLWTFSVQPTSYAASSPLFFLVANSVPPLQLKNNWMKSSLSPFLDVISFYTISAKLFRMLSYYFNSFPSRRTTTLYRGILSSSLFLCN